MEEILYGSFAMLSIDDLTARKFLCFAQEHPIYSGGSTGLTDFFGAIVRPSISQRNCCCVRERTSWGLRGHWNRLSDSLQAAAGMFLLDVDGTSFYGGLTFTVFRFSCYSLDISFQKIYNINFIV